MHKERVYLFPMHLSNALPQARKNAQGIIHPRAGVLTLSAVLAKIVVVFWINGYPPQFHNGISPPPFPEAWSSSALNRFDGNNYIIFPTLSSKSHKTPAGRATSLPDYPDIQIFAQDYKATESRCGAEKYTSRQATEENKQIKVIVTTLESPIVVTITLYCSSA